MATKASPELQPWVRKADRGLTDTKNRLAMLNVDLARIPVPDKSAYGVTTVAVSKAPGSAPLFEYPAGASVVHTSTTGLVEVTITPKIRVYQSGTAGVGIYTDAIAPTVTNELPLYGVGGTASAEATGLFAFVAASNVTVLNVPTGPVTYNIFYYTDTTKHANAQAAIDGATIIVRSL